MNPAVSLGAAVMDLFAWPTLWVYPIAQTLAGIGAGVTFLALNADDKCPPERSGPPGSAIDRPAPVPSPQPRARPFAGRPGEPADHRRNRPVQRSLARRTTCRGIHPATPALHGTVGSAWDRSAAHRDCAANICTRRRDRCTPPQVLPREPVVRLRRRRRRCRGPGHRVGNREPAGRSGRRPGGGRARPSGDRAADPTTSARLLYRPGNASGMAAALLRLLTSPTLRNGMACRAADVARRHPPTMRIQQPEKGNGHA